MIRTIFLLASGALAYLYFTGQLDQKSNNPHLCERPPEFPDWIEWNCEAQAAYESAKLYVNEDTSAIAYPTKNMPDTSLMIRL